MAEATTPSRASVATIEAISCETKAKPINTTATCLPSEIATHPSCNPESTNVPAARPNRPMVLGLASGLTLIRTWRSSASHAELSAGVSSRAEPSPLVAGSMVFIEHYVPQQRPVQPTFLL